MSSHLYDETSRVCSRCGGRAIGQGDFHSGIYQREGRLVRLHGPRSTVRCLNARCGQIEVVADRSKPDDRWLLLFQPI